MADMTHAARARQWLDDPGNRVQEDLAAKLNASLAESTATREISVSIIAQTREFATRLHDLASALEPDAGLVRINTAPSVFVNPRQVTRVIQDGRSAVVRTTDGGDLEVPDASAEDIAAKLGVSV